MITCPVCNGYRAADGETIATTIPHCNCWNVPYSVSEWERIGKERGYWSYFEEETNLLKGHKRGEEGECKYCYGKGYYSQRCLETGGGVEVEKTIEIPCRCQKEANVPEKREEPSAWIEKRCKEVLIAKNIPADKQGTDEEAAIIGIECTLRSILDYLDLQQKDIEASLIERNSDLLHKESK